MAHMNEAGPPPATTVYLLVDSPTEAPLAFYARQDAETAAAELGCLVSPLEVMWTLEGYRQWAGRQENKR